MGICEALLTALTIFYFLSLLRNTNDIIIIMTIINDNTCVWLKQYLSGK